MGNRAAITKDSDLYGIGVYLRRNGGRDSVEAFLAYCDLTRYRANDAEYWAAMLVNVCTNFFASGLSCGVGIAKNLDCDNYDNGVYFIDDEWRIVGRKFEHAEEYNYDLEDMIKEIDKRQPEAMRLTESEWERFRDVKDKVLKARV